MFSMFSGQLAKKKHEIPGQQRNFQLPRFGELPMFQQGQPATIEMGQKNNNAKKIAEEEYEEEEDYFDETQRDLLTECNDETGYCYA
jgi:hypothetical protein